MTNLNVNQTKFNYSHLIGSSIPFALYCVGYFFFRNSLVNIISSMGLGQDLGTIAITYFSIFYTTFQLAGPLMDNIKIHILILLSSILVVMGNMCFLVFYKYASCYKYLVFLGSILTAIGFAFSTTALINHITNELKKLSLNPRETENLFASTSSYFMAGSLLLGLILKSINSNYNLFRNFTVSFLVFSILILSIGVIAYIRGQNHQNYSAMHDLNIKEDDFVSVNITKNKKEGFFESLYSALYFIFTNHKLTILVLLALFLNVPLYLLGDLNLIEILSVETNCSSLANIFTISFPLGFIIINFIQRILGNDPMNAIIAINIGIMSCIIYILFSDQDLAIIYGILVFLIGLSGGAQICYFSVVGKKFSAKNKPTGTAFSLYNFFGMFGPSVFSTLTAGYINSIRSVPTTLTSNSNEEVISLFLRYSLLCCIISLVTAIVVKSIIHYNNKRSQSFVKNS